MYERMISLIVVLKANQSDYFKYHCHRLSDTK